MMVSLFRAPYAVSMLKACFSGLMSRIMQDQLHTRKATASESLSETLAALPALACISSVQGSPCLLWRL